VTRYSSWSSYFERQDDLSQYHPDVVVSLHVRCFITLMMLTSFLRQGDIRFSACLHHEISEGRYSPVGFVHYLVGGDLFKYLAYSSITPIL